MSRRSGSAIVLVITLLAGFVAGLWVGRPDPAPQVSAVSAVKRGPEPRLPGEVPAVDSPRQIVLPLDRYLESSAQASVVRRATVRLGAGCLRRFGLPPLVTGDSAEAGSGSLLGGNDRRYGLLDPTHIAKHGYGFPHVGEPQPGQRSRTNRPPSSEQITVWLGRGPSQLRGQQVPEGGCAGEAERRLARGALPASLKLPELLMSEAYKLSERDSRVSRAFQAWSACMRRQGFQYRTTLDVMDDVRWEDAVFSALEARTAFADVACKKETNVAGIWLAVETAYQLQAIAARSTELAAVAVALSARERNASELLAGR